MREPMGERTELVRVRCESANGTATSWTETITGKESRTSKMALTRTSWSPGFLHGRAAIDGFCAYLRASTMSRISGAVSMRQTSACRIGSGT